MSQVELTPLTAAARHCRSSAPLFCPFPPPERSGPPRLDDNAALTSVTRWARWRAPAPADEREREHSIGPAMNAERPSARAGRRWKRSEPFGRRFGAATSDEPDEPFGLDGPTGSSRCSGPLCSRPRPLGSAELGAPSQAVRASHFRPARPLSAAAPLGRESARQVATLPPARRQSSCALVVAKKRDTFAESSSLAAPSRNSQFWSRDKQIKCEATTASLLAKAASPSEVPQKLIVFSQSRREFRRNGTIAVDAS